MVKKEFKEIIFPALIRFGVFMIPVLFMTIYFSVTHEEEFNFLMVFTTFFGLSLYWVANHFGTQAFKTEFRDDAFEYLFSLPYSKYRILFHKIAPRLAVLLLLTGIFEIFAITMFSLHPLDSFKTFPFHPVFFPVWVFSFFLWGFFLGLIEDRSRRALMNLLVFFFFSIITLGIQSVLAAAGGPRREVMHEGTVSTLLGAFLVIAVLGGVFLTFFRKFDLRKVRMYDKKFIYRAMILFSIFGAASAILLAKFGVR